MVKHTFFRKYLIHFGILKMSNLEPFQDVDIGFYNIALAFLINF